MPPFKKQLQTKLAHTLSKGELEKLPASFQRLGHVVILRLPAELLKYQKIIGEAALVCVPGTKTACVNTGKIDSEFRQPKIEFVAGEDYLEVDHHEHGCVFRFDVSKLMWSMGNMNERKRMYEMVQPGETVVDFFAGIGYWSIPIAKHTKAKHVYAIDANPDSIASLRVNKKLNKIPDEKMTILSGKCEEVAPTLGRIADRIILGYLPAPAFALAPAFHTLKSQGGMIHYEGVCEEGKYEELLQDVRAQGEPLGWSIELINAQQVKSMAPRKWHYVLDIRATPITIDEGVVEKPPQYKQVNYQQKFKAFKETTKEENQLIEIIRKNTTITPKTSILDIGCAKGSIAFALQPNRDKITLVDVNESPTESGAKFITDKWENARIHEKFDIIVASHIWGHFEYSKTSKMAYTKMVNLLNTNGQLIICHNVNEGFLEELIKFSKTIFKTFEYDCFDDKLGAKEQKKELFFTVTLQGKNYKELAKLTHVLVIAPDSEYQANMGAIETFLKQKLSKPAFQVRQRVLFIKK